MRGHTTSKSEINDLRAVIERDLVDASLEELSDDRRFATAYNAALQTAKMVVCASSYRVSGQGHHQTHFVAIEVAMGQSAARYAAFFETCRRKRNMVDYDLSGIASRTEVEQLIDEAEAFLDLAEAWIADHHRALARDP